MFDDFDGIYCQSWNSAGKVPSRHHISEDQKIPKKYQKFLFSQMTNGARRADLGGPPWAQTRPRRGPLAGRAWDMSGRPGPPLTEPARAYLRHGNLRSGGASREILRRLYEAENHEER